MGVAGRRKTAIDLIWLKMRKGLKLREVAWSSQAEPLRLRAIYLCGLISERSGSRKDGCGLCPRLVSRAGGARAVPDPVEQPGGISALKQGGRKGGPEVDFFPGSITLPAAPRRQKAAGKGVGPIGGGEARDARVEQHNRRRRVGEDLDPVLFGQSGAPV